MTILVGAGTAVLALLLQAHGAKAEFETDVEAATTGCIEPHRDAIESQSVGDAEWKQIITCVFANTAAQMDAQLPKKIDPITTLVSVSSNGATFNYTYVIDVATADFRQENIDSLEAAARQNACTDPSMTQTMELGGAYFYRWVDRTGTQITTLRIEGC
ncbi:MAG: hypothetical protein GW855_07130 [Erythrobacter sp.]|nr:hypothetical protein [Erythrobacter sp.]NCQ62346.1 hypothetical protein [Alphaproteobacteria bacterium]